MGKLTEEFDVEEQPQEENIELISEPTYGSEEWNDYVMSLFHKDEVIDGNPLCRGLRRVVNQVLGEVVSSKPVQTLLNVPDDGPGRATIVYEVQIDWMGTGEIRTYGDVAEVWHINTDDVFLAHPAATACTRAEGRCLRKALMINCLSAEELTRDKNVAELMKNMTVATGKPTTGEISGGGADEKITDRQKGFLENKCRQLNVNVMEFLNMGSKKYESLSEVTKQEGVDIIKKIVEMQNKSLPIPDYIGPYVEDYPK